MKLKITPDTTVGQALSAEPRLYGALLALGLCCVDENTVMVYISRLRAKIEDDPAKPKYIQTVRGLGYRFAAK